MKCPFCDSSLSVSAVIKTYKYETVIHRTRQCMKCRGKYRTEETYAGHLKRVTDALPPDYQSRDTEGQKPLPRTVTNGHPAISA